MNRTIPSLVAMFALMLAAGCRSPGGLDVCHANCDNDKQCDNASSITPELCHELCDHSAEFYENESDRYISMRCTNAGQLFQAQLDCLSTPIACEPVALHDCQEAGSDICVPRPGT